MGIKDIATFIKKTKGLDYGRIRELKKYRHRIIAIDGGTFYSRMMINNKIVLSKIPVEDLADPDWELSVDDVVPGLLSLVLSFIGTFLSCGVVPLIVFDGSSPDAKGSTRAKRNKITENSISRIDNLRDKYSQNGYLDVDDLSALRKELCTSSFIKREHFDVLKEVLRTCKISYVQSREEAERLCVSLVKDGVCKSAYSMDSDMIAHLCPHWIQEVNGKVSPPTVNVIDARKIARDLELSEEQLVDFCIMCGCDYNERISGLGPAKSYNKLIQYKSLDSVYTKKEAKPLRVEICRDMFSYKKSSDIIDIEGSYGVTVVDGSVSIFVNKNADLKDKIPKALGKTLAGVNMSSIENFDNNRIKCSDYWRMRDKKAEKKKKQ